MNLTNQIKKQLFRSPIFKGLLDSYTKTTQTKIITTQDLEELTKEHNTLPLIVQEKVQEELKKADLMRTNEAMRYRGAGIVNSQSNPDRKPGSDIPFSYLRRMATIYPIARACINRRIRQITKLGWEVTTIDEIEDEKGYEKQIQLIKQFFKQPMGHKTRMRELLTIMIDDVLTLDAVTFEMQKTRGGEFMSLIPVDPTTISLRVTQTGGTPTPPDAAYVQIIDGQKINEFTTEEMIYESMNARSFTPYGLAPLESLIIQVESAIRGAMYNLNYFKESNVPEGFVTLPEDVAATKGIVEEWQQWFDMMLAGDARFMHRLKILPGGSEYTAAKKPEDMAFERFEMWLLQQTCMVFDVQPQDIGITYQVNKATGETQRDISDENGLKPLANFVKEIFDDIIQNEMKFPALQFGWINLDPVDLKEVAEVAKIEIDMGAMSVDEYRVSRGQEPLGLEHYIMTSKGPLMVKDLISGKVGPLADTENAKLQAKNQPKNFDNKPDGKEDDAEKLEMKELKNWRKCIYNDLEMGRDLRKIFPSPYISKKVRTEIQKGLSGVTTREQAKLLFDRFLDPDVRASMVLLEHANKMRELEHEFISS